MGQNKIDILERALAREKAARKQAEKILEDKSAELYRLTRELSAVNSQLEHSIQEKDSQLKGIFENINDAYVVMDLNGFVLKMNEAAVQMLGYDFRLEKVNLSKLVHPNEVQKTKDGFRELYNKGFLTNFQLKIVSKAQGSKIVQINASMVYDADDTPIAAQGIVRDITHDIIAQEQLIASENRLSTLILNLDSGVLLVDETKNIVLTNNKLCELFYLDMRPNQMVGVDINVFAEANKHYFEDPESFVSAINDLIINKEMTLADELRMVDGTVLERDYIPIYENNQYKGHLWSYRDVTLQRKYRRSIEVEKQKYSNIIANMNLGLLEVSNDDEILMANHSFLKMSGYTEKELIGRIAKEIFLSEESFEKVESENSNRLIGKSNSYELLVKTKEGAERSWLISGAPNYNLKGEVIGSIGIHLDITDFRNLEKQKELLLIKLEKSNRELEEYAHIVSHDLKSPLRSINALVNWLKEDNQGKFDKASLDNISLLENTLEKMEQLISDVLTYSSITSESFENQTTDLNAIVEDLRHVLFFPKHIQMKVLNPLPIVRGDAIRLQQLFQNLIGNAIQYIDKDKGCIEIAVQEKPSHYQFSIKDNGVGIEKQHFEKIFKIFQSLNPHKESSGIGLSIVKKIVNQYQGEVWVTSEPGVGSTFFFTLKK